MDGQRARSLRRRQSFTEEFRVIDDDGDGSLTIVELTNAMLRRHPQASAAEARSWAEGIIRVYDADGNGRLDRREFQAFMNERYETLRKTFDALDTDGSGRISAEEVKQGLVAARVPHLETDVDRVLRRMGGSTDEGVTADGVSFSAFFSASVLLPVHGSEGTLLTTLAGSYPVREPPPGTTPTMIVAAGFINGAVSRTVTAPTDRLRALLATGAYPSLRTAFSSVLREQGVRGFWSSNLANVIQVAPENGISFALNEVLRDAVCRDPEHPAMAEKFLLGGAAGAVAMSVVYPLYVVQNRQAAAVAGQYSGMADAVREVARGGMGVMYAGYGTALVRVLPLKGIMLGGYSTLKDACKDPRTGEISTTSSLLCSAAAGGAAHACTYPLHLARTVLQQPVPAGGRAYAGFVDVLRERMRTQGLSGCFRGLPIWLCNRVPAVAIEFAVNERALSAMKWFSAYRHSQGEHFAM